MASLGSFFSRARGILHVGNVRFSVLFQYEVGRHAGYAKGGDPGARLGAEKRFKSRQVRRPPCAQSLSQADAQQVIATRRPWNLANGNAGACLSWTQH